jgi:hypothetical protein
MSVRPSASPKVHIQNHSITQAVLQRKMGLSNKDSEYPVHYKKGNALSDIALSYATFKGERTIRLTQVFSEREII